MRPGLLILPFLAVFFLAIATALKSAYAALPWIAYIGWSIAFVLFGLWIVLDLDNFKALFQRKGSKYGAFSGLTILLTLVVIGGVAKISMLPRFNKSYDTTSNSANTLSDQSKKTIANLAAKNVEVDTTVFYENDASKQSAKDLLSLYEGQGARFIIKYLHTVSEGLAAKAEKLTSANTIIFRTGTQEARVTTFTEEKLTNALIQMLKDQAKKIYFTTGHGESGLKSGEAEGLQWIAQDLENNKYTATEVSLLETAKVPDDADLLVIAGPRYDFKEEELRFVDDYINKGGPLFVMLDAGVNAPNLNRMMEKYGLKFNSDVLIINPSDARAALLGAVAVVNNFDKLNAFTKDFANEQVNMILPMTRSISVIETNPKSMKVSAVAKTANSIIEVKGINSESDLNLKSVGADRIEVGEFPVVVVATGQSQAPATAKTTGTDTEVTKQDVNSSIETSSKKELRIVAVGSGQFATNGMLQRGGENRDLFVNITNYLLQDEDFISIRPKDPLKTTLDLNSPASGLTLLLISFIYPFVFLFAGIWHWARRRRA